MGGAVVAYCQSPKECSGSVVCRSPKACHRPRDRFGNHLRTGKGIRRRPTGEGRP